MTTLRTFALTLVAGAALVVSGCGGDDSEVPASTKWAGDLCTAVRAWQDDITSAVDALRSNPSRAGFTEAADDAKAATETLVDTVKGLGAPNTEAGDEVRSAVETFAESLRHDVDTIQDAVAGASGVQGLLAASAAVSTAIGNVTSQISSFEDELESLGDVDDELRQSFADAESCDGLIPPS